MKIVISGIAWMCIYYPICINEVCKYFLWIIQLSFLLAGITSLGILTFCVFPPFLRSYQSFGCLNMSEISGIR